MAVLWQFSGNDYGADLDLLGYAYYVYTASSGGVLGNYIYGANEWYCFIRTISYNASAGPTSIWAHTRVYPIYAGRGCFGIGDLSYGDLLLVINSDGYMSAYRQGDTYGLENRVLSGTLLGTGTFHFNFEQWYSLDIELTKDNSAGVVKTWVNGVADLNLTGQDTRQGSSTAYINRIGFLGYNRHDDMIIGDTNAPNASHAGEVRVDCMFPNANGTDRANGGTGEMTRSTGSDDYTLVDETAPNTTDYVYADDLNERCSLNIAALTNTGGTIVAVQCTVYATKSDVGPCGFKIYMLTNGTRYYSEEFFPSFGSWNHYQKIWDQHPYPSNEAWTESDYNACEFGVERTT